MKVWLQNAWLVVPGVFLLAATLGLGEQNFSGALKHFFFIGVETLPQRTLLEFYILYRLGAAIGTGILSIYCICSLCGVSFLSRFFGVASPGILISLISVCFVLNGAFLTARLIRQIGMEYFWSGLDQGERLKERFVGLTAYDYLDPNAYSIPMTGSEAALALIRVPPKGESPLYFPTRYLFVSYYLFPRRVYYFRAETCDASFPSANQFSSRRIGWIARDCLAGFEPVAPSPVITNQ